MASSGSSARRRALITTCKALISAGLLTWLLTTTDLVKMWRQARAASPGWLAVAVALYLLMLVASAWRWRQLLSAQHVHMRLRALISSYLAATFFNNFLPSNIGGDVVRIRDTADAAGSKTVAATVVLADRILGVVGLVFVASLGASLLTSGRALPVTSSALWLTFGMTVAIAVTIVLAPNAPARLLKPLSVFHPEWVTLRLARLSGALGRFRDRPSALIAAFVGAVFVQAILVGFYLVVARSLAIPIEPAQLAVLVPMSFLIQMLPISVNGLGVREATFLLYFARLGLPPESALALSLMAAALVLVVSLLGGLIVLFREPLTAGRSQGAPAYLSKV